MPPGTSSSLSNFQLVADDNDIQHMKNLDPFVLLTDVRLRERNEEKLTVVCGNYENLARI